jgi:hypothetical protein
VQVVKIILNMGMRGFYFILKKYDLKILIFHAQKKSNSSQFYTRKTKNFKKMLRRKQHNLLKKK